MNEILNVNDYDKMLLYLIPRLDEYNYSSGVEGKAYFIDDNFVVKVFFDYSLDSEMFDCYCQEIQNFANMGLTVPKIYSWCNFQARNYILEERIPGKNVFNFDVDSVFYRCEKFCSKDEFAQVLKKCDTATKKELLSEIIKQYILEFIETNENLLNMSDANLEKFIDSDYFMTLNSVYSQNDIFPDNVIFDRNKLTIIDNAFVDVKQFYDENSSKVRTLKDIICLFDYNEYVKNLSHINIELADNYVDLQNQNEEVCFEALRRFVRKLNEMHKPVVKIFGYENDYLDELLETPLNNNHAREIFREIDKQF